MLQRAMESSTRVLLPAPPIEMETTDARKLPKLEPMTEYAENPLGFFVEKLGIPEHTLRWELNAGYDVYEWDGTKEPLLAILEGLVAWDDVAVESATGTGKSFLGAAIILWFVASFYEARVFTFAPKEEQLRAYIWMEIGKLWDRFHVLFPTAVLTDLRIRMRGVRDMAWGAQGYAVGTGANEEVSTKAQGMHAKHMLLIYEETPGIKTAVTEAGANTCTAPHNIRLAFGNPDHQLDALHLFGHDMLGLPRPGVRNVRISALDHPNLVTKNADVVPGAASEKSIRTRLNKYGAEHQLYKSRVRGISPAESKDALIKLEWVRAAQTRWANEDDKRILTANGRAKRALGVDVANSDDGDEAAIADGIGAWLESIESFPCPNANNLGYKVHLRMKEKMIEDEHVGVDDVGVGAGTVNELKRLDHYIKELGGGDRTEGRVDENDVVETEQFDNLRSQMAWTLREDIREGRIALPPEEELARELTVPTWKTDNSKIVVESKNKIKARTPGGKSPNKMDATMYWNWVRDRTALASTVPKKHLTTAQRIQKELEDLDRQSYEHYGADDDATEKYGTVIRQ
jgi:phage terminase large subunit